MSQKRSHKEIPKSSNTKLQAIKGNYRPPGDMLYGIFASVNNKTKHDNTTHTG